MQSVLLTHVLLDHARMNFTLYFVDYRIEVVFVLQLQLLVMRAALVRRSFLEDLGEAVEDLGLPSGLFREEILSIFQHKLKINLILMRTPSSSAYFFLIDLKPQLFNLMVFGLKTFLAGVILSRRGPPVHL